MSDKQIPEQRDSKYWIKPGVEVAHRDFPERKMIVDNILKKTEDIKTSKGLDPKTFTVGIECHWFLNDGGYARGRFLTMELLPFGEDPGKPKKTSGQFPDEIPSDN